MIAFLHLHGTPLSRERGDLTPLQIKFLEYALPEVLKIMYGGDSKKSNNENEELKAAVERRRREGGS